jgi:hypothetical protein
MPCSKPLPRRMPMANVDEKHVAPSEENPMTDTRTESGPGLPPAGSALLRALVDNWGLLLLRGVVAIAFGAAAFAWPGLTVLMLT